MDKEELYKTILISPVYKYSLLNEIYAIRDTREEYDDYTIGVNGFISLDVLLENYNQINMIEDLQNQLKKKDKIINEAKEYLIKLGKQPDADLYYCINEHKEYQKLLEILERGKNEK